MAKFKPKAKTPRKIKFSPGSKATIAAKAKPVAKPKPVAVKAAKGEVHTLRATDEQARDRVDKVAAALIPGVSRSRVQKAIDLGQVKVNGKVVDRRATVEAGDSINLVLPVPDKPTVSARKMGLPVLFEDKYIIVINKPAGLITHPVTGSDETSVVHALLHQTKGKLAPAGGTIRPGIVHRLDRETSGVMIVAKSDAAFHGLIEQFSGREPDKEYIALVDKVPRLLSGTMSASIDRHRMVRVRMAVSDDGKEAVTDWQVEARYGAQASLIRARPRTGRTHQIRVHLAHLGHAILGDRTYGKFDNPIFANWPMPRVMLHAHRLHLVHPVTGKAMVFTAPIPKDFIVLEKWLAKTYGERRFVEETE